VVIEDKIEGVDPFCSVVEVFGRIGVIDTDGIVLKGCVMIVEDRIVGDGAIRVGIVGSTAGIVGAGGSTLDRV